MLCKPMVVNKMITKVKSLIGVMYPIAIIVLVICGLIWLSSFITIAGSIILGLLMLYLAKFL